MSDPWEIAAAVLALAGYWLVIRRNWTGMAIWVAADALWLGIALADGRWAQAAMWAVYAAGACWGAITWRRHDDA